MARAALAAKDEPVTRVCDYLTALALATAQLTVDPEPRLTQGTRTAQRTPMIPMIQVTKILISHYKR